MSGSGVGETPNAAFAAVSARVLRADGLGGWSSSLSEAQGYLDQGDDKSFTEALDRRCPSGWDFTIFCFQTVALLGAIVGAADGDVVRLQRWDSEGSLRY